MMHRCFRKADLNMGLVAIVSERALLSTGNLSVSFAQCGINPQRIAELTLISDSSWITNMSVMGAMLYRGNKLGMGVPYHSASVELV